MTWSRKLLAAVLTTLAAGLAATPASAQTTLRLDGIGPLELGMKRSDAVATGWLRNRGTGCELAGPPLPIVYDVRRPGDGTVRGFAEFRGHRLRALSFIRGVRTGQGVTVGRTTLARMVARYRAAAGFTVRSDALFGGTFVSVRRGGRLVLGAFGAGRFVSALGIPSVPFCE